MKKAKEKFCYFCGGKATTKEHFPPKIFFPEGVARKTVPSCQEHNNDKSKDDTYIFTCIALYAQTYSNLAKEKFYKDCDVIFKRSPKFKNLIFNNPNEDNEGYRQHDVNKDRFNSFFNALKLEIQLFLVVF